MSETSSIVLVKLDINMVKTNSYSKTTDSHNYVNIYSSPPKHINKKVNIPYNLTYKHITIICDEGIFNSKSKELAQGYPGELIRNGTQTAIARGRAVLTHGLNRHLPGGPTIYMYIQP